MVRAGYIGVPEKSVDGIIHRREIATVLNNALSGKINVVTDVTLTDSATTTTLIDARISAFSFIWFMPKTTAARDALPSIYITDRINGQATINHASDASTEQDFDVLIIG